MEIIILAPAQQQQLTDIAKDTSYLSNKELSKLKELIVQVRETVDFNICLSNYNMLSAMRLMC